MNNKEHFAKNIYNRFHGSLEPLKNLTELKNLNIANTDIDSGVGSLPKGIEMIYLSSEKRPESKVSIIESVLQNSNEFVGGGDKYIKSYTCINPKQYLEKNHH